MKWNLLKEYSPGMDLITALLENRKISSIDKDAFLNPPPIPYWLQQLDITFLKAIKQARQLILDAISSNTTIVIHGDYDADGICATAVLYDVLKNRLGYENTLAFIPNRFEHGYGLSVKSIDYVLARFPGQKILVVSVDSGITAFDETAYLKSLGHQLIITDHHQKPELLPAADCIVWNDQVVGTTIAWLLASALHKTVLDLVGFCAIATVTDLQPVLNFNRTLVKTGLELLNENPPVGIKKLLQVAHREAGELTTYELGWVLGPRLNASGRIDDASAALDLLLEKDEQKALNFAQLLNDINVDRQDKTLEMYEKAIDYSGADLPKIIFAHNADFHEGIIGLVAAKLVQKHYRPAIVITQAEAYAKGSVRSVTGINIIELLRKFEHLFLSLGGHPMAAGFSIAPENIPVLQKELLAYAKEAIADELLVPALAIDLRLPANVLSLALLEQLDMLKPYGLGNPEPVFATYNLGVTQKDFVGRDKTHVILRLFDGVSFYKAILFNGVDSMSAIGVGDTVDIAYTLKLNNYNGKKSIDLILKDIRSSVTL